MYISASITGIKYTPLLCRKLQNFNLADLGLALSSDATFILVIGDENKLAVSWWVSAKRTRSYPYARVYDSLGFAGKKVTIIPVFKDEGKDGDRDFLQWDTVSLMSLLGVYVIVGYYEDAEVSARYRHKITNQRFALEHVKSELIALLSYQSDALHWNLAQIDKVGEIGQKAFDVYSDISRKLKVEMHSATSARARIARLLKSKEDFKQLSRKLAEKAQKREQLTIQPKESLSGSKAVLTIRNYLGGYYYFTSDEAEIVGNDIYLIEGKHSETHSLPSLLDIKDGLLKMMLFTNLKEVNIEDRIYHPLPILKLTIHGGFNEWYLSASQKTLVSVLRKEAEVNGFHVQIE